MTYTSFIRRNLRFLAFGFLLAFASSFGQTFFIALSGGHLRGELGLTHGSFGAVYSAATLASGLLIVWAGTAVDRFDLRIVSAAVCAALALACLGMGAAHTIPLLFVVLFGLRFTGQGLLGHVAATSMTRYFPGGAGGTRGKALSIAALGYPAGEALLPGAFLAAAAAIGWRESWTTGGVVLAVTLAPASLWLLRGHGERHTRMLADTTAAAAADAQRQWRRREVLRDLRFYLVMPAILAPPFVNTGVFFHQTHIAEVKGWPPSLFAAGFAVYAATTVTSAIAAGNLVDRFGAIRLMPAFLPPLVAGLLALSVTDDPAVLPAFMLLAGVTQGSGSIIVQSMWAERYGVTHLGAIRALATSFMVISTSASPVILGTLFDAGVSFELLAVALAGYTALAIALLLSPPVRLA